MTWRQVLALQGRTVKLQTTWGMVLRGQLEVVAEDRLTVRVVVLPGSDLLVEARAGEVVEVTEVQGAKGKKNRG